MPLVSFMCGRCAVLTCKAVSLPRSGPDTFSRRMGILIPAFNEASHIRQVIARCRALRPAVVLVVDDASRDETSRLVAAEAAERRDGVEVRLLRNRRNLGKQGAVRRGLRALCRMGLDGIALIDGDGQHAPEELVGLAGLLDEYDFVIGARARDQMPLQRRLSNALVNLGFFWIGGVDLVDVQSGLRIYRPELAAVLAERLGEDGGYVLEHESLAVLADHARAQGLTLRAAAATVSCRYGHATSSMGPAHIVRLAVETVRHALRLRTACDHG